MKSLKKLVYAVLPVALLAALFAAPAYAAIDSVELTDDAGTQASSAQASGGQTGSYVFDEYGALTSSQFEELESRAAQLASEYDQGVYLLITDTMGYGGNPTSSQRNEFARSFYVQNNLGVGANKSGIIFAFAIESRDYVTVKKQLDSSADPFSDEGVDALEERVTSYLSNNNWYGGSDEYYDVVDEQLAYFAATGNQWTEPDPLSLLLKVLAILGIPAVAAGSIVRGEKAAMKTAREKTEASDYLNSASLVMSVATDRFINTTVAATPRVSDNDSGGGGGWSDMGGGFSGSGGGKF